MFAESGSDLQVDAGDLLVQRQYGLGQGVDHSCGRGLPGDSSVLGMRRGDCGVG
jgi:hypothetical protein